VRLNDPVQTITLKGNENIAIILSLLEQAEHKEVLLFVPQGCEALEDDEVNLNLLRRWADNLAITLGLVIEDRATQVLAKEVGFVVLPSLEQGQRANLAELDRRRRRRKGLPPRPTIRPLLAVSSKGLARGFGARALLSSHTGMLLAMLVLVVLLSSLTLFLLPTATVTLEPLSEPVAASLQIQAVLGLAEVDYEQARVPARTISVQRESSDTIATTNKRDIPDGHAQGTVLLANKTTIPVTITQGTIVRTSFGENVRFYTIADTWVPGELYSTARVGIIAAEPGPAGNVAPLTINVIEGEHTAQVDVLNDTRTSGGTVRRVSTVDGVDKVNLRAKLSKRIQEEAYQELTSSLRPGEFVPAESLAITVLSEVFDHKIDDVTDQLGLTMQVEVTGLAVNGAEGEELLLALLGQRLKPGYAVVPDSATFERGAVTSATSEEAQFTMSARAAAAPAIDSQTVASAIAGQTAEGAIRMLMEQVELRSEPEIELRGSILRRLPWWAQRIHVRVVMG
jgi:hypothetical protein